MLFPTPIWPSHATCSPKNKICKIEIPNREYSYQAYYLAPDIYTHANSKG